MYPSPADSKVDMHFIGSGSPSAVSSVDQTHVLQDAIYLPTSKAIIQWGPARGCSILVEP